MCDARLVVISEFESKMKDYDPLLNPDACPEQSRLRAPALLRQSDPPRRLYHSRKTAFSWICQSDDQKPCSCSWGR